MLNSISKMVNFIPRYINMLTIIEMLPKYPHAALIHVCGQTGCLKRSIQN